MNLSSAVDTIDYSIPWGLCIMSMYDSFLEGKLQKVLLGENCSNILAFDPSSL